MSAPVRFELSWRRDSGYHVSVPCLLRKHGARLPVREDRATDSDIEALAARLWELERHQWTGAPIWSDLYEDSFWSGWHDAMCKRACSFLDAVFAAPRLSGRSVA
jgi:hypothetical protein